MALKAVTSIFVVEQVVSGEHVEHEIGDSRRGSPPGSGVADGINR
jgi:hypothetical protein